MHTLSRSLLPIALLVLIVLGVFGRTVENQFVYFDDQNEIFQNPDYNPVTWKGLAWNWSHTRLSLYMPVTYMTWGAIAAISSRDASGVLEPRAFHALNVGLHALCTVLVYLVIVQLWGKRWPAWLGALAFAVHPLQAEPVAWASGMYTLLSAGLCLGAILAYINWVLRLNQTRTSNIEHQASNIERNTSSAPSVRCSIFDVRRSMFALATLLYAAALLTKAASVSLPLAVATMDLFILGRPIRSIIKPIGFWILLGIPIVILAKHFQDVSVIAAPPLWARPLVALDSLGFYLRKILLPIRLIPDYGRTPAWVMQHPAQVAVSIFIAGCALLCAYVARRQLRWITAAVALLAAGTLPYLGLTAFDFQYISTVADRYAYFGLLGLAILVAAIVMRSRASGILILGLCGVWAVLSWRQVGHWRDTITLFDHTLQVNQRSLLAHAVFGYMAAHESPPDRRRAEAEYLQALSIWPQDAEVHFNLGNLYLATNASAAARQFELAVRYAPRMPQYHNNYGVALAELGDARDAYEQWEQAIQLDPQFIQPHNIRGDMCFDLHQYDAARRDYQAVLAIDPNNPHALEKLAQLKGAK